MENSTESTRPEGYTLTLQDIKDFVAAAGPKSSVGMPRSCSSCLVASALKWKYPWLAYVEVEGDNETAEVFENITESAETVYLPTAVETEADTFDTLGAYGSVVTREELEARMPQLFN